MRKLSQILSIVMLVCILCACGGTANVPTLTFADSYSTALDYEQIAPLLEEYFSIVYNAYEHSDKQKLKTFELSSEYDDIVKQLEDLNYSLDLSELISAGDEAMEAYLQKLALYTPYRRIEIIIAKYDLLVAAGNSTNEEWFDSLIDELENAYEQYSTGD